MASVNASLCKAPIQLMQHLQARARLQGIASSGHAAGSIMHEADEKTHTLHNATFAHDNLLEWLRTPIATR